MKQGLSYPEPFFGCFDGLLKQATGLQKRGMGEEIYLQPLIDRVQIQYEPHRDLRRAYILEGIEGFIQKVSV